MTRCRGVLGVVATVLVVTIAGCTPAPVEGPSGSPAPSFTAGPPTPTPDPTKPAVAELILSPDGLGPLKVAQAPPATDPSLDILIYDPDYCAGIPEASSPGMWLANYPLEARGLRPFTAAVDEETGLVTAIAIFSPEIETATGIHLGSTTDELMAAYPGGFSSELRNDGISAVYSVAGTAGQLLIEVTTDGMPGYWPPEMLNRVNLLTVILAGEALFALSGSDAYLWGECVGP